MPGVATGVVEQPPRKRKQNKEKKGVGIKVNHHQEEERCKFATFPLKNEHSPPIGCSKLRKITRIQKNKKHVLEQRLGTIGG